jgi:hypothetical protein
VNLFCLHVIGERGRSAARDLGLSTPPDFIASPLHRLVRRFTANNLTIPQDAIESLLQRLAQCLFRGDTTPTTQCLAPSL